MVEETRYIRGHVATEFPIIEQALTDALQHMKNTNKENEDLKHQLQKVKAKLDSYISLEDVLSSDVEEELRRPEPTCSKTSATAKRSAVSADDDQKGENGPPAKKVLPAVHDEKGAAESKDTVTLEGAMQVLS